MCQYLSFGPNCPQGGLVECAEMVTWFICVVLIASPTVQVP